MFAVIALCGSLRAPLSRIHLVRASHSSQHRTKAMQLPLSKIAAKTKAMQLAMSKIAAETKQGKVGKALHEMKKAMKTAKGGMPKLAMKKAMKGMEGKAMKAMKKAMKTARAGKPKLAMKKAMKAMKTAAKPKAMKAKEVFKQQ